MIRLFTGTPGSGKSYDACRIIVRQLKAGRPLIANFPVNEACVSKPKSRVDYWDNSELTPDRLMRYAIKNHKAGKEGQTLVIIDECQVILNCRDFGRKDRNAWVNLMAQHRKLGFDFILITQNDRFIDKQVRCLVEEEVKHRKLNNSGFVGLLLSLTLMTWFVSISYWYGGNKSKIGQSIFTYNKKYEKVYDSYRMFDEFTKKEAKEGSKRKDPAVVVPGGTACGGAPGETAAEPSCNLEDVIPA